MDDSIRGLCEGGEGPGEEVGAFWNVAIFTAAVGGGEDKLGALPSKNLHSISSWSLLILPRLAMVESENASARMCDWIGSLRRSLCEPWILVFAMSCTMVCR